MKQKEMLRKAAWVAFGLVLAIEVTAIAGRMLHRTAESDLRTGTICAYARQAQKSPFSDVVQTVMPCVVGVSNRGEFFQHHQRTN